MTDERNATAVELAGVTLAHRHQVALRDVDLALPAGRVSALVGPNGSGKSTLLHAIAGLLAPVAGTVTVLGRRAHAAPRLVAYVLQAAAVNDHLPVTVREVVTMGRYAAAGPFRRLGPSDRSLVAEAIERLELGSLARRHLGELSGGERQRVFVAQGLAQAADLLLLDEPVTGLDLASRQRIATVIAEERAAGRTVVVSTHDLGDAAEADHLVLLAGRVVAAGTPESVLTAANLAAAYGGRMLRLDSGLVLLDDAAHHDHPH